MQDNNVPMHNTRSIYAEYVRKLLKDNPEWWSLYSKRQRAHIVYRQVGTHVEEVISYDRFKEIVVLFFQKAQDSIIKGKCLRLTRLGTIAPARVERNFKKRIVNFHETCKQPIDPETGKRERIIYYDSPDWCRIRWNKPYGQVPWVEVYEFKPCDSMKGKGGFKDKFRQEISQNEATVAGYTYIPYYPKKS